MGEQEFENLKDKVQNLKRGYFEQISDEQAAEINPKKLYASLIMLAFYDVSADETYIPGLEKSEELQSRRDDLGDVLEIVFPIELDSKYFVIDYNDGNMESQISNEEMKQKFPDTLNLLNEILDIDESYASENFDLQKITTNAITDETGTSIALAGDGTSIIKDTITYENVIPDLTYRVKGRVIDRKKTLETGTEVVATGTDGKPAVNSIDFTPGEANEAYSFSLILIHPGMLMNTL